MVCRWRCILLLLLLLRLRPPEQLAHRSMRSLLEHEQQAGSRMQDGSLRRQSAAEALLWSRIGLLFWVETFDEHVRTRGSLAEESVTGFMRSMGRYFDRFARTVRTGLPPCTRAVHLS